MSIAVSVAQRGCFSPKGIHNHSPGSASVAPGRQERHPGSRASEVSSAERMVTHRVPVHRGRKEAVGFAAWKRVVCMYSQSMNSRARAVDSAELQNGKPRSAFSASACRRFCRTQFARPIPRRQRVTQGGTPVALGRHSLTLGCDVFPFQGRFADPNALDVVNRVDCRLIDCNNHIGRNLLEACIRRTSG
jgi:hypothetical protein